MSGMVAPCGKWGRHHAGEERGHVPQTMATFGDKTPKMALYYCRLANQPVLNDRAAEIIDAAFEKPEAAEVARSRPPDRTDRKRVVPLSLLIV
jgi:hypothetical protein